MAQNFLFINFSITEHLTIHFHVLKKSTDVKEHTTPTFFLWSTKEGNENHQKMLRVHASLRNKLISLKKVHSINGTELYWKRLLLWKPVTGRSVELYFNSAADKVENLLLYRFEVTSGKNRPESTFAILHCCCHELKRKQENYYSFWETSPHLRRETNSVRISCIRIVRVNLQPGEKYRKKRTNYSFQL